MEQQVTPGQPATVPEPRPSAARTGAVHGVEGPDEHEPLDDRATHPGPLPEVGERVVGRPGDDAGDLPFAHALDVGEGEADPPPRPVGQVGVLRRAAGHRGPLDAVLPRARVDVDAEDAHPERAGLLEEQPLGVHARVVGEDTGEEGRRVVRLEPGGLVGRHGEGGGVRLAEAEGGEGGEHRPDAVDVLRRVAAGRRGRPPPLLDASLPLGAAHRPAHLVGLREGGPGRLGDDPQHLLVEDDDPLGLGERRDESVVEELRPRPAVPGLEEGADHVRLHRSGTEEGDVDDEVVELGRGELADELALPRALDLEAPERAGRADHREGRRVLERDVAPVVEVDPDPLDALDLPDGVRHRRLHPDAEDVELEQAERLDVVLVELTHGEAQPARLDRGAVEQPPVGEDDPARVQGDVPGQPVEPLDEVEEHPETTFTRLLAEPPGAQLGQLGEGAAHVLGPDVREGLGDLVDLRRGDAQRGADIADRVPRLVGVHHRHARDPVPTEALEDPLVHLGAPGGLDVDVDVGQLRPQR